MSRVIIWYGRNVRSRSWPAAAASTPGWARGENRPAPPAVGAPRPPVDDREAGVGLDRGPRGGRVRVRGVERLELEGRDRPVPRDTDQGGPARGVQVRGAGQADRLGRQGPRPPGSRPPPGGPG